MLAVGWEVITFSGPGLPAGVQDSMCDGYSRIKVLAGHILRREGLNISERLILLVKPNRLGQYLMHPPQFF